MKGSEVVIHQYLKLHLFIYSREEVKTTSIKSENQFEMLLCAFACEDKLEVRYKLDGRRAAEVLRSTARSLADGRLHAVSVRRRTDAVSLQVTTPRRIVKARQDVDKDPGCCRATELH